MLLFVIINIVPSFGESNRTVWCPNDTNVARPPSIKKVNKSWVFQFFDKIEIT